MTEPDVDYLDAQICASSWRLLDLELCVKRYLSLSDMDPDITNVKKEWFPFSMRADSELLMYDTSSRHSSGAPVIAWDTWKDVDEQPTIASALAELVRLWVDRLASGNVNARIGDNGNWQYDYVRDGLISMLRFN